ncbi:hypothetical protein KEM55_004798 [Ascosphaera atra]|nr:hypothetical protein KEM55_004798 [Ascosphaera atra]
MLPIRSSLAQVARSIPARGSPARAVAGIAVSRAPACAARRSYLSIARSQPRIPSQKLWSRSLSSSAPLKEKVPSESESEPLTQYDYQKVASSLPSARLIDVREPSELRSTGVIPGAVNIPLKTAPDAYSLPPDEFLDRFGYEKPGSSKDDENKDFIFYCLAGVRARSAAELARQAGFKGRIGVYDGSWKDWEKNNGKVEKWDEKGQH